ncbi:MAG: hypothetical protein QOG82_1428 [Actinomycetota bacterium]|nr:hypothetical protein [Actinomycetota bacterium]
MAGTPPRLPQAKTRLTIGAAAGAVVFAGAMSQAPWQVASLLGWDTTAVIVVALVLLVVWRCDSAATHTLARPEDNSRGATDLIVLLAGLASLVGVALALLKGAHTDGPAKAWITVLAVASVVLSWLAVQTVFTLRYAHLFYSDDGGVGGVDFNGDKEPDYRDFAYLAFTIGMTYQVSDTDLTTKVMRRTATRQGLLSYVFGTFVVAMTINVVAGLVK